MIATLIEVDQGTPEWFAARLGRATASRFGDIIATTKSGTPGAGRRNYRAELLLEYLTGEQAESYINGYMLWGQETEELARVSYALETGLEPIKAGFFQHDDYMAGASPDGLVGEDGLIEIKCKTPANHVEALKLRKMPQQHVAQVQGQLWITERLWCDFVSFDPRFPGNAQLLIDRVYRDEEYIAWLAQEVSLFLDEVAEDVEFIQGYKKEVR